MSKNHTEITIDLRFNVFPVFVMTPIIIFND
jgi:hypothetical protein